MAKSDQGGPTPRMARDQQTVSQLRILLGGEARADQQTVSHLKTALAQAPEVKQQTVAHLTGALNPSGQTKPQSGPETQPVNQGQRTDRK